MKLSIPSTFRSLILTALCAALAFPALAQEKEAPGQKPLVVAFQKQKNPEEVQASADAVAAELSERLGRPVEVIVPASYSASVQAMVSNKAQVAYVSSIPFLLARQEAPVECVLAEVRDDKTAYTSIFVVRKDSPYQTLEDLEGKRMMFTSPTSTSGYVMAYSRLVNEGLLEKAEDPANYFSRAGFAGGYDRALLAVLNGQADVCAVSDYTMTGPKADLYLTAEQREGLRILTRTGGVPTHLIAVRSDLPKGVKESITSAFLAMSEEHPELLSDVYGAAEFKRVDEEKHVEKAVEALENTGLGAEGLVK